MHNLPRSISWPSTISVLIPAYKAADSLSRLLPSILSRVPAKNICVVDDGSLDATNDVCDRFGVKCLTQPVNRGKGAALRRGFEYLTKRFDWIITMDADGQHSADDLERFIDAIKQWPNAGIIIGARTISLSKMPAARVFSNTTTSALLTLLTGRRILDSQSGFRAYNASFVRNCTLRYDRFEMESEIILRTRQYRRTIFHVPVQTLYCSDKSHIAHFQDTLRWVRAVVLVWAQITWGRIYCDLDRNKK